MPAYELRIGDWSSDVCSSVLPAQRALHHAEAGPEVLRHARQGLREAAGDPARRALHLGLGRGEPERGVDLFPGPGPHPAWRLQAAHEAPDQVEAGTVREGLARLSDRLQRSEEHTPELQSLMRI